MFPIFLYTYLLFAVIWDIIALPLQAALEVVLPVAGSWILDIIGFVVALFFKFLHFFTYGLAQKRIKAELKEEIKAFKNSLPPSKRYMAKKVEVLLNEMDKLFEEIKKKIWQSIMNSIWTWLVEMIPILGSIVPTWTMDAWTTISNYDSEQHKIQTLRNKVKSMSIFVSKKARAELKKELAIKRQILQNIAGFRALNEVNQQQIAQSNALEANKVKQSIASRDYNTLDYLSHNDPALVAQVIADEIDDLDLEQMVAINNVLGGGANFNLNNPHTQEAYNKALVANTNRALIASSVQSKLDNKRQQAEDLVETKRLQATQNFQAKRDKVDSQLASKRQYAESSTNAKTNYVEEMRESQNQAARAVADAIRAKKA